MPDLLIELFSEEIPARMQAKAKEDLARLFNDALSKAGLAAQSVETFATPRRLALIAKGLPLATEAVSEETKGPKAGAPPQAMVAPSDVGVKRVVDVGVSPTGTSAIEEAKAMQPQAGIRPGGKLRQARDNPSARAIEVHAQPVAMRQRGE